MNYEGRPLSRLHRTAAFLTLTDPEILETLGAGDRDRVLFDFFALVASGIVLSVLWTVTLSAFDIATITVAIPVAAVVITILILEVRMAASDTRPRGVLAAGQTPLSFYAMLAVRLVIALCMSSVTAVGVDLLILRSETARLLTTQNREANAKIFASYDAKIAEIRGSLHPLEKALGEVATDRRRISNQRAHLDTVIAEASARARAFDLEKSRQLDGVGNRVEGRGKLYRDAEKQQELTRKEEAELRQRLHQLAAAEARADVEVTRQTSHLAREKGRVDSEIARLVDERDTRLHQPLADGPIERVVALMKLRADPEKGAAVTAITIVAFLASLILEMCFLLARVLFRPASLYEIRLNKQLKEKAVIAANEFRQNVADVRSPRLHVVTEGHAGPHDRDDT